MIKKVVRKSLKQIGLLDRVKAATYKELTQFLSIKDGFVYYTNQIEFRNNKLFSTGDDPQILFSFNHKTSSVSVDYNIDHKNDQIEIFCSNDGISFDEKDKVVVGECDGEENSEIAPFNKACKYFRLDLVNSSGEINIKKIEISPNEFSGDKLDLRLEQISDASNDGYVVVTHAMDGTGAPLLAYNISKKLKERGAKIVVVTLCGGFLEKKYREQGIPVFSLYQGQTTDKILRKKELYRLAEKLKEKGYCKLIANTTISGITTPYFKRYNYEIISLVHEMKNSIVGYKMENGGRDANFYSDCMIFPDKIVKEEFREIFDSVDSNDIVLPQGLYKEYKENVPDKRTVCKKHNIPIDAKIIFGSGSADLRKGIDLFLNAATELVNEEGKGLEYHFIWTGDYADKNLKNWLNYQIEKIGLKSRIHIVNFVKDAKTYQNMVECADVFWLTSREDPFPSVMIEALKYNTPVIAFKGCGGADTLLDKERGILIDNFDTRELAKQTKKLIGDPARMKRMLSKAQKYIDENLKFDGYIDKLIKCYSPKKTNKFADLSVVIPNYNYEEYLPMRISSILNQTILPKEIILLDDNSKDKSVEVVEPLLKAAQKQYGIKYKIIKNKDNQGCFRQWVRGFKEASYDYVWMAEADDYARPTFVETLMPSFKDKKVVLSYCKSCVIDSDSTVADYDYNSYLEDLGKHRWEKDFVCDGKDFVINYLSQKNVIPNASSTIIRKSATKNIEKYLNDYQAIGDWFAYIYIISQGKVNYSANILNGHRRHGKSIIANQEKSKCFAKEMIMIKTYLINNFRFDDKKLNKLMISTLNENFDIDLVDRDEDLRVDYTKLIELYHEKETLKNLLVILPDFEVGGGQAVGIRFANSFKKYYNVFVLNTREKLETKYMREMIDKDVEILKYDHDVERLRFLNTTFGFKAVLSLIWWSDKLSYQAFADTDVNRIISMHGCYENILDNPEIDPFFDENVDKMLTSASHVVYTAEKNRRVFNERNINIGDRLTKIDNGFLLGDYPTKTRKELGIGNKDFVFGLVARGIPEKGYEQAINGINYVNQKVKNKAHLVLVGSGEYIDGLKAKYTSDHIHFIDNTTEPLEWIGWEDIFDVGILPSYFKSESMPTAVIEMLFLGKPIISTDIGEIKSMLIDGKDEAGIVIQLKNGKPDQTKLNEAMLEMIKNPKRLEMYKKNTKKLSNRFDMDKCINAYRKLIEEK